MTDIINVPSGERILQIGYGRLGKPFYHYLSQFIGERPHLIKSSNLEKIELKNYDYVFLCTKDNDLDGLILKWSKYSDNIIHFSGSIYNEKALGVHPVYSFSSEKDLKINFKEIDFTLDKEIKDKFLKTLFVKKSFIHPEKKKEYHLHLSLMANFSQLLANEMAESFINQTGVEKRLFFNILKQSIKSVEKSGEKSFSGPWIRNERKAQNEMALNHKSEVIRNLNQSFNDLINSYKKKKRSS